MKMWEILLIQNLSLEKFQIEHKIFFLQIIFDSLHKLASEVHTVNPNDTINNI